MTGSDYPTDKATEKGEALRLVNMAIAQQKRPRARLVEYKNDTKIIMLGDPAPTPPKGKEDGTAIKELSFKARKRMAFNACNANADWLSMLTLTYQEDVAPRSGRIVKKHLNTFLNHIRRNTESQYFWFLEFMANDAPHIHVLLDQEPSGRIGKNYQNMKSTREMCRLWTSICDRTGNATLSMNDASVSWEVAKVQDGFARYASKYAYKMEQKQVPEAFEDVGRFWGMSKTARPLQASERLLTQDMLDTAIIAGDIACWTDAGDTLRPYTTQHGKTIDLLTGNV